MLPLGISFYTFQSFAYSVDVLTGRIKACQSFSQFLLFVTWFPQLVAGPISRASTLLPQIVNIESRLSSMGGRLPTAAALFAEGWLRKTFADLVSTSSDTFFANPSASTSAGAVFGIIGFGIQIYADFSGYTKMAQGASWLFGVQLAENFNLPYTAVSVRDFWRRWHISLSTWFRDYLYIPIGGNRNGMFRTYFNLAFTMLVCGMWHGANWTFLLWGGLHALLLILERVLGNKMKFQIPQFLARSITLVFVLLAWVPFRAANMQDTRNAYTAVFNGGWEVPNLSFICGLIGIIAVDFYYSRVGSKTYLSTSVENHHRNSSVSDWHAGAILAVCILTWSIMYVLGQNKTASFIYFQF